MFKKTDILKALGAGIAESLAKPFKAKAAFKAVKSKNVVTVSGKLKGKDISEASAVLNRGLSADQKFTKKLLFGRGSNSRTANIDLLFVTDKDRGKGLGTKTLVSLMNELRKEKIGLVTGQVVDPNALKIRLAIGSKFFTGTRQKRQISFEEALRITKSGGIVTTSTRLRKNEKFTFRRIGGRVVPIRVKE